MLKEACSEIIGGEVVLTGDKRNWTCLYVTFVKKKPLSVVNKRVSGICSIPGKYSILVYIHLDPRHCCKVRVQYTLLVGSTGEDSFLLWQEWY